MNSTRRVVLVLLAVGLLCIITLLLGCSRHEKVERLREQVRRDQLQDEFNKRVLEIERGLILDTMPGCPPPVAKPKKKSDVPKKTFDARINKDVKRA